jgi:hypothetical protein
MSSGWILSPAGVVRTAPRRELRAYPTKLLIVIISRGLARIPKRDFMLNGDLASFGGG